MDYSELPSDAALRIAEQYRQMMPSDAALRVAEQFRRMMPSDTAMRGIEEAEAVRRRIEQLQLPNFEEVSAIQRSLERLRLPSDEILKVLHSEITAAMPVVEIQRVMAANLESMRMSQHRMDQVQQIMQKAFSPLESLRLALTNSILPLPDMTAYFATAEIERLRSSFASVSKAFENATFIADVDLSKDDEAPEDPTDIAERAEEQIIEIVPADTLERLKRVDFAPITLLDDVLRDPDAMRALSARDFEGFVATLIEQLGFEDVTLTPRSGDGGRDVLAVKRIHGLSILCAFECKRYAANRPIGPDIARSLLGVISHGETRATTGILVTTSYFTPAANKFILTEPNLDMRDFDGIVDWLRECRLKRDK